MWSKKPIAAIELKKILHFHHLHILACSQSTTYFGILSTLTHSLLLQGYILEKLALKHLKWLMMISIKRWLHCWITTENWMMYIRVVKDVYSRTSVGMFLCTSTLYLLLYFPVAYYLYKSIVFGCVQLYILIVCVFLQYTSQLYLSFYISTSRRRKPYCAEPATHLGRDPRAPVRHLFNFFAQCQQNLEINKQHQHPCFANCLQDHHLCFGPNIHNFLVEVNIQ